MGSCLEEASSQRPENGTKSRRSIHELTSDGANVRESSVTLKYRPKKKKIRKNGGENYSVHGIKAPFYACAHGDSPLLLPTAHPGDDDG